MRAWWIFWRWPRALETWRTKWELTPNHKIIGNYIGVWQECGCLVGLAFIHLFNLLSFFCVVLSAYKFLPLPSPTIQLKSPWKPPFHFHQRKSNLIWNVTYSRHTWHFKDVMPGTLMKTWLWKPVNVVLNHLSVAEHYSHTVKPTALFTMSCLTIFLDKTI